MPEDDKPELEEYEPPPWEEVVIATAEFCNVFGGCEVCDGHATVGQLRSVSKIPLPPDLPDNQIVLCTHWCHLIGLKTL